MTATEYRPKYKWRETWPGEGHQDFAAWDEDLQFGRILEDRTSPKRGQWIWAINHIPWQRLTILPHHGWAPTAREASRMVEGTYEKVKQLHCR
ncbi:hypothetical protein SAMN05216228_10262 [Rhizobium tibeticum]|uniref:Uncharacterized protein n=1 Tax=Rhizobium tibeticum TaxID=501024 RepID=A0A1H8SS63_9HYPH|nr:hypothetical protein [Rhizobium tibeticum]SEI13936.1 hypothetical protein RTCCBAU85039_5012 [Rhizobium tibeticum]SEO81336.1 hypothetical protein SAMN05216228_10262 [Rhizobium tibeticum]